MSDIDEELKRVRLQREKLALREDERRAARRQQTVDLAYNVAATTREAGVRTVKTVRTIVLCILFGTAVSFVAWVAMVLKNFDRVEGGFEFCLGWYMRTKFLEGSLIGLLGAIWCYYQFFRNRRKA